MSTNSGNLATELERIGFPKVKLQLETFTIYMPTTVLHYEGEGNYLIYFDTNLLQNQKEKEQIKLVFTDVRGNKHVLRGGSEIKYFQFKTSYTSIEELIPPNSRALGYGLSRDTCVKMSLEISIYDERFMKTEQSIWVSEKFWD